MKKEFKGIVKENPYGDWDDVDKGLYIGIDNTDNIEDIIRSYKDKRVKLTLTIEEISDSKLSEDSRSCTTYKEFEESQIEDARMRSISKQGYVSLVMSNAKFYIVPAKFSEIQKFQETLSDEQKLEDMNLIAEFDNGTLVERILNREIC